jgi:hypothetical protein
MHGGLSTGYRTEAGRQALLAANRRRWERWRQAKEKDLADETGDV